MRLSHPNEACFVNKDGSYLRLHLLNSLPQNRAHPDLYTQIDTRCAKYKGKCPCARFTPFLAPEQNCIKSVPTTFSFTFSTFPLDWPVPQHILPLLLLSITLHHLTSHQRLARSDLRNSSTHKKKPKIEIRKMLRSSNFQCLRPQFHPHHY